MKKMKFTVLFLCSALLLGSCGTMNNKAKGGIIGGGSGAAAGAIIGGLIDVPDDAKEKMGHPKKRKK